MKRKNLKTDIARQYTNVSPAGLHSHVMDVTPDIAAAWLEKNNTKNRELRQRRVDELAAEMKAGRWLTTHQGISFDTNNQLNDGQHRLWAVVQSGVTVKMMVTFNEAPEAFLVTDVGATRSMADLTGFTRKDAELLHRIVRFTKGQTRIHPNDVLAASVRFLDVSKRIHAEAPSCRKAISTAAIKAGLAMRMALHPNDADHAVRQYKTLTTLHLEDSVPAVAAFGRRMIANPSNSGNDEQLMLAYRAFDPAQASKSTTYFKDLDAARIALRAAVRQFTNLN